MMALWSANRGSGSYNDNYDDSVDGQEIRQT